MPRSARFIIVCAAVLSMLPALASADVNNAHPKPTPNIVVTNPVGNVVQLSFTLKQAGSVSLSLYDVAGRLVKKLIDAPMSAGAHQVQWNRSGVSGGVYFARLRSGEGDQTSKVLLAGR